MGVDKYWPNGVISDHPAQDFENALFDQDISDDDLLEMFSELGDEWDMIDALEFARQHEIFGHAHNRRGITNKLEEILAAWTDGDQ